MELNFYAVWQVLDWWREYTRSPKCEPNSGGAVLPKGYPSGTIKLDPVSSGIRLDRRYLAWIHVERFFAIHVEWYGSKAHLLMGEETPCLEAFGRWYEKNPMMITADAGAAGTVPCPELVPMMLGEALEAYNRHAKPKDRRKLRAAQTAAATGRLTAWRPKGKWTTTADEIRRWVEADARKNENIGTKAA